MLFFGKYIVEKRSKECLELTPNTETWEGVARDTDFCIAFPRNGDPAPPTRGED